MRAARGRALAVAAAVAGLSLLAAGCGGSGSPSIASVGTTASSTAATGGAAGSASPPTATQLQQGLLKYAECMRAKGVPGFPDPSPSGGFQIAQGSGVDPSSPAFKTAQTACRKLMAGVGPTPGSTTHPTTQWLEHMVKVAQCMRRRGISAFPDPTTTIPSDLPSVGGGVISDIDGVVFVFPASTVNLQSPAFVRAAAACGFPLHNH